MSCYKEESTRWTKNADKGKTYSESFSRGREGRVGFSYCALRVGFEQGFGVKTGISEHVVIVVSVGQQLHHPDPPDVLPAGYLDQLRTLHLSAHDSRSFAHYSGMQSISLSILHHQSSTANMYELVFVWDCCTVTQ